MAGNVFGERDNSNIEILQRCHIKSNSLTSQGSFPSKSRLVRNKRALPAEGSNVKVEVGANEVSLPRANPSNMPRKHGKNRMRKDKGSATGLKGLQTPINLFEDECAFCHSFRTPPQFHGPMAHYQKGKLLSSDNGNPCPSDIIFVHKKCLEWAPRVFYMGDTIMNLELEIRRASKLKCARCRLPGAALGCYSKLCNRTYHVPCAMMTLNCRWDVVNCYLMCPEHATEILQSDKINSPIEETGNSSSFPQSPLSIEQGTFADCEREDHRIDQRNTSSYFPQGEISAKGVSAVQNSEMDKLNTSCSSFPQGQDKDVISTNDRRKEKQKDHLCAERNCSSDQWVLLGSALSASEKDALQEFASWTGATVVIEWTENVTHVIVGRSVGSAWSRSYEVLMALLFGKWIVTSGWIMDFLVKFTASPETTFELRFSHNSHTSIDGNNKRRNQASEGAQKLFSGLNFCLSAYMNPDNRQHIESLIGAAGGQILEISGSHSLWGKNANLEKPLYFVYNGGFVYHGGAPSEFTARLLDDLSKELGESVEYAAHGARVISNLKLFDAIAAYDAQILNHKG